MINSIYMYMYEHFKERGGQEQGERGKKMNKKV